MADLKEFLDQTGNRVVVHILQNGIVAYYPPNILCERPEFTETITLKEDGVIVTNNVESYTISLPEWAISVAMLSLVMSRCLKIGYRPPLIKFMCGDKEVANIPDMAKNKEKASYLIQCIQNDMLNGWYESADVARQNGIYKTYQKLVQILE